MAYDYLQSHEHEAIKGEDKVQAQSFGEGLWEAGALQ